MSKGFDKIFESIPLTPNKDYIRPQLRTVKLSEKFPWDSTVEGHQFWSYVNKRLYQLAEGIGYKYDEDI